MVKLGSTRYAGGAIVLALGRRHRSYDSHAGRLQKLCYPESGENRFV